MNSSNWIWRSVSIISAAATLLLIAGFVYAIQDVNYPQRAQGAGDLAESVKPPKGTSNDAIQDKKELKVAALGDSLAKGTGDSTGSGFVRRSVQEYSKDTGKKVTLLNNLGINGLTTTALLPKLEEQGTQYVLAKADVILLSIGGNDLFRGADLFTSVKNTSPNESSSSAVKKDSEVSKTSTQAKVQEIKPEDILKALPQASLKLQKILVKLREINPNAVIIYVGLYNPFGDLEQLKIPGNEAVTTWNNAALSLINKNGNMMLVPTFDLFQQNLNKYLSSDHFHPNGDGYQQIAERIVQSIR
ncbi:GDSL-type esterase/lipase family protein [Paenibacillus pini]|uniref:Lipase/acylhydrolase n=1 Tax=Paenibacillus pini JCM 16418 TaxID=1236976 RepID=W7Z6D8_9BACL|nr:GDSL-type esterase/lipase family protein [Paenibacillus pini]GAF09889.1 lipase/acylhydrolase [Paenibacillus pini JCM 16418]